MLKKELPTKKHVHIWEQYYPKVDQQLGNYLGWCPQTDSTHVYRKCECGLKEKAKAKDVNDFPESMRLYADVTWEETNLS